LEKFKNHPCIYPLIKDGELLEFTHDEHITGGLGIGFFPAEPVPGLYCEDLVKLLREELMSAQFADERSSIEEKDRNYLFVVQTAENHETLARHLNALRQKLIEPVRLTARWLTVDTDALPRGIPASLDGTQTERVLKVLEHPKTRVLGVTRLRALPEQQICAFGGLTTPQVSGYNADAIPEPKVGVSTAGTGFQFKVRAQSMTQLKDVAEEICVETLACLSAFDPPVAPQDPFPENPKEPRRPSTRLDCMPGLVHSAYEYRTEFENTLRIPDGGSVLFRYSVPEWLHGEPKKPAKRARRTLVLSIQAERVR